jgi:two-component system chemotaxis response regulator CheB
MKALRSKARPRQRSTPKKFAVIVIGGSAGSVKPLLRLLQSFPKDMNAAICVVLHMAPDADPALLIERFAKATQFICSIAEDDDTIREGRLYLAPPRAHLIISKNKISFGKGPDENRFKPSIDVLFRSVAVEFRERAIGILLSGYLDDGVAGMIAIKKCGGIGIVQDPADADYADLPNAAIKKAHPDYSLPVATMGNEIFRLTLETRKPVKRIAGSLLREAEIELKMLSDIDETKILGVQSLYTCPDCGGTLFTIHERPGVERYRCFTGHAFSETGLLLKQNESLLLTLWTAVRMFEERKKLLENMAKTGSIHQRQKNLDHHISMLKNLLADIERLSN